MSQIAYLDPSSLSLWFDPSSLLRHPAGLTLAEALAAAIFNDTSSINTAVSACTSDGTRARCFSIASLVWHEKRHFLDLVLTNYGSRRIRQYFNTYANQWAIAKSAASTKAKLLLPISAFSDEARYSTYDAWVWRDSVAQLADLLSNYETILSADLLTVETSDGAFQVGGDAQLEAIAFVCQMAAVQQRFGLDASALVQRDLRSGGRALAFDWKYNWAMIIGERLGVVSTSRFSHDAICADSSKLIPMLYVSLFCRSIDSDWNREDSPVLPTTRLYMLAKSAEQDRANLAEMTLDEAWEYYNALAKRIWGKTAIEELEDDYKLEERTLSSLEQHPAALPAVKAAFRDYHRLRRILIEILKRTPSSILCPTLSSIEVLDQIRPMPVWAAPASESGKPYSGWTRSIGCENWIYDGEPLDWWWTAVPDNWSSAQDRLTLQESWAWQEILEFHAPMAKLFLNGRKHFTMLGPEMLAAEKILREWDIDVVFEAGCAYPEKPEEIDHFYYNGGTDQLVCDFCRSSMKRPEGNVLSPWILRINSTLASICIYHYGGGEQGRTLFARDWSPWIICNKCFRDVRDEVGKYY